MLTIRRFFILLLAGLVAVTAVMGQNNNSDEEMSVEESYLQEAIEMMIIRETSRADNRDQKMVALEYIGNAIDRGNKSDEIRSTLEYLSMEGVTSKANINGRITNDFPDVRRQAAKYLGSMGSQEAKRSLIRICRSEVESMVLQEAIKSLGDLGINDNNESVEAIVWVLNNNDSSRTPDNLVALSGVDAIGKLAKASGGALPQNAFQILSRITAGGYIPPARNRARQVLADLTKYEKKS